MTDEWSFLMGKQKKAIESFLKRHNKLRLLLRKIDYRVRRRGYEKIARKHEIESNLVLFESFMGRQFTCNPRAIYEELLLDERFKDYYFVWALQDAKNRVLNFERTIVVEYKSKEYYEYCARAKYIITNSGLDFAFQPKKEQLILQTWHGTPLKRLRCDIEAEFGNANNSLEEIYWKNDVDVVRYDYFLSPSKFASDKFKTAFRLNELNKQEIIIETGYPRNDFLFHYTEDDAKRIKQKVGIDGIDKKVILYAPTFRENQHQAGIGYTYKTEVDFQRLKEELSDEYIILFRPHYFIANQFDFEKYKGFIYNVADIDDVKELYVITDLLITDYSSVFFDYAVLKRPILFYMYDLEAYAEDIRGFYMSLDQLPGDIVETEDALIEKIKQDVFTYDDRYRTFNETFNNLEDGKAGKRLINQFFFGVNSKVKPDVVVLSRNYSTGLGIIRSLGASGYNIDLVASTKKKGSSVIASKSKYVRSAVEVLSPDIQTDSGEALIKALMQLSEQYSNKAFLLPTDDFTASVVDGNKEILEKRFLLSEIGIPLLEAMDKTYQSRTAKEAGLHVPSEWIVALNGEIEIPCDVFYPCFVKPLRSVAGHKTEMSVCQNRQELISHLEYMKKRNSNRSILIQEYLKIEKEYSLSGVCLDQNVIIPAVIEKTEIAEYERGVAITGTLQQTEILIGAKAKIEELLRKFHYKGLFDMDLSVCNHKIYFGEINFRCGGSNYAYYLNGVNLPDIFLKEVCGYGHREEEEQVVEFGRSFVYEKVAWEDYIYSYKTKSQLKKIISEAEETLLQRKEDPAPGRIFNRRIRLSALKHRLYRMIGR